MQDLSRITSLSAPEILRWLNQQLVQHELSNRCEFPWLALAEVADMRAISQNSLEWAQVAAQIYLALAQDVEDDSLRIRLQESYFMLSAAMIAHFGCRQAPQLLNSEKLCAWCIARTGISYATAKELVFHWHSRVSLIDPKDRFVGNEQLDSIRWSLRPLYMLRERQQCVSNEAKQWAALVAIVRTLLAFKPRVK